MYANAPPIANGMSREELDALTRKIIGCAQKVSRGLGAGFLEKVYENALRIELVRAGCDVVQQARVQVRYGEEVVGDYVTDLLVDGAVVIEVKACESTGASHGHQCVNYLRATGCRVCLLLNFGQRSLGVRRFVKDF